MYEIVLYKSDFQVATSGILWLLTLWVNERLSILFIPEVQVFLKFIHKVLGVCFLPHMGNFMKNKKEIVK